MNHHALLPAFAGLCLVTQAFAQESLNRAYARELVGEASTRATLLQDESKGAGGWQKGKFFITDGGANTLNLGGYIQARYLANFRDEQPEQDEFAHGFQLRRTRLTASGTVWDKNLGYYIQGDFGRADGQFVLNDAWARYSWANGTILRWGQFKLPLLREELASGTGQLTVERSVTNFTFSQQRSQGVEVSYTGKQFRVIGAFSDGLNTANTDFTAPAEADLALTGRADFMFAGDDWKRFDDHTSWQDSSYAGMVGIAAHYQSGGETLGTSDIDLFQATADITIEGDGWNAFVAGIWRNTDTPGAESTDDFGVVAQAGVFLTNQVEVFGRYDVVIPDMGENFNTITGGASYYISPRSHAAKLTADVLYFVDPTTETPILRGNNTRQGLLADPEGGQIAFRLQMQVVF